MTIDAITKYVDARIATLNCALNHATEPHLRFELSVAIDELERLAAWMEVQSDESTHELGYQVIAGNRR